MCVQVLSLNQHAMQADSVASAATTAFSTSPAAFVSDFAARAGLSTGIQVASSTFLTDQCPSDDNKTEPGPCGCGAVDDDSDSDGTPDCVDSCPSDPDKTSPGQCGCGEQDVDADADGYASCVDACEGDAAKQATGVCGCGTPETDSDSDSTPDCTDECAADALKTAPGVCGCGVPDSDADSDGTPDCDDTCPDDPAKTDVGLCGCGVSDADDDADGTPNCHQSDTAVFVTVSLQRAAGAGFLTKNETDRVARAAASALGVDVGAVSIASQVGSGGSIVVVVSADTNSAASAQQLAADKDTVRGATGVTGVAVCTRSFGSLLLSRVLRMTSPAHLLSTSARSRTLMAWIPARCQWALPR